VTAQRLLVRGVPTLVVVGFGILAAELLERVELPEGMTLPREDLDLEAALAASAACF